MDSTFSHLYFVFILAAKHCKFWWKSHIVIPMNLPAIGINAFCRWTGELWCITSIRRELIGNHWFIPLFRLLISSKWTLITCEKIVILKWNDARGKSVEIKTRNRRRKNCEFIQRCMRLVDYKTNLFLLLRHLTPIILWTIFDLFPDSSSSLSVFNCIGTFHWDSFWKLESIRNSLAIHLSHLDNYVCPFALVRQRRGHLCLMTILLYRN